MPDAEPLRAESLRADALRIWQAGVDAVLPEKLLPREVEVAGNLLRIGDWESNLSAIGRIVVVGAGKAGAGMVGGLEAALGPKVLAEKQVTGWVNVPAGTVRPTEAIHLHVGRPAGVNEPRPEGVEGTREILRIVRALKPNDLCLCLLSGGGSALLPAPATGVLLEDKVALTRLLSASGATIDQLNTVRRQLSDIKGGGLARACGAGQLITLLVSDVLGDPLETIASGPTAYCDQGPDAAIEVLSQFGLIDHPEVVRVVEYLKRRLQAGGKGKGEHVANKVTTQTHSIVLANNATAVDAAGIEAERLGYNHAMICATESEGPAEEVGRHLAQMALSMRAEALRDEAGSLGTTSHGGPSPNCLISGGEPTVRLVPPEQRGKGGRNQQLILAALQELGEGQGIAMLSGGTDGEDGPTDAAGAWVDAKVIAAAAKASLSPQDHLTRNDAYPFFESAGGLLKTGPTHTNVCDIRVVVVDSDFV